jgi:transcription termination factor Rho
MAGEQLERSILERKERDELHAIASAMSLKLTARSKKADIIDVILAATGVGDGPASAPAGSSFADSPSDNSASEAPVTEAGSKPRRSPRATARPAVEEQVLTNGSLARADGDGVANNGSVASDAPRMTSAALEPSSADFRATPLVPEGRATSALSDDEVPAGAASNGHGPGARSSSRASSTSAVDPSPGSSDGDGAADSSGGDEATSSDRSDSSNGTTTSTGTSHSVPGGSGRSGSAEAGNGQGANGQASNGQGGNGQGGNGQGAGLNDVGNRRGRRRRGRDRTDRPEGTGGQEPQWQGELVPVKGLLDLREEGYGFLRTGGYLASPKDVYVSVGLARRLALRRGDAIEGACRPAGSSEKYPALVRIDTISGQAPDDARNRPRFEDLTPLFPDEQLHLETANDPLNLTARIVDLISPIGKGQRGMIVSPPKAGKTTVMKQIAHSIELNNPEVHLIVLLVDERPEEVTDMRRSVKGEVIASTFDRPADEHTAVAELTIERAKRLVEMGRDVVIILDGITRLARAYNLAQPATGRIMSGGVDSGALYPPKKFFGAARNIEEGGSLTILATALVETGSRMDEVIFEEFKGTGNLELRLDRRLAERRLYPAIDVNGSSTRHEELLFDRSQLQQVWKLRRVLNALGDGGNPAAGLELLMDKLRTTRSNQEFLAEIAKAPVANA